MGHPAVPTGDGVPLLGFALLEELRTTLGVDEITGFLADYVALTGWDSRTQQLFHAVGDRADLSSQAHCEALLHWLRAWGCRHLRRADTARTGEVVCTWWDTWEPWLPERGVPLTELDEAALSGVAPAYDALRTARAAARPLGSQEVDVIFGDTATSKTLFALRPELFLPWDDPIRLAFGWWGGGAAYVELLGLASTTLHGVAARLGVEVSRLPDLLGRPQSPPPKLVDEYLWTRVTKVL